MTTATETDSLVFAINQLLIALPILAAFFGGIIGLQKYNHSLKIKAGEILLQIEEEFRVIFPTCFKIETMQMYEKEIRPPLKKLESGKELNDIDKDTLIELDRCLRFFYICSVFHTDLKIEKSILARSYYWHACTLTDAEKRPELEAYLRENYKRLSEWLDCQADYFEFYKKHGKWKAKK